MNALNHMSHHASFRPLAEHIQDLPTLGKRINAPSVARNPGPARPWLITIVDLMTILLTFFVLLFSMAKIDMVRFIPVARSYGEAFAGGLPDDNGPRLPEVATVPGDNLSYLEAILRPAFAKQASLADVQFRATPQYLILSWPASMSGEGLFDAGSSGFSDAARRRVFDLGGVLSNLHNRIAIVGQAATLPALGAGASADADADADAWRLAITRANAVADAFTAAGYDKEITVLGRKAPAGNVEQIQILIMPEQPGS
ncbi:MAG: flagellar motor protein MotB [Rhodospirillaceae bacterium]